MAKTLYTPFLDKFPKIQFDINQTGYPQFETVTSIFFRIGVLQDVVKNIASYYVYEIDDGDTPESLAEKVYGDSGAHWVILYANNMFDPQFDWPLGYDAFKNYIIDKYGSVQWAQTNNHHYEMVITRTLQPDNIVTETRFAVNDTKLTQNELDVTFDYYEGNGNNALSRVQTVETFNIFDKTLTQVTRGEAITYYDYEDKINEDKRLIKVIKAEYYPQIMRELTNITNTQGYTRTVK